jgi:hypothetical protein
MYFYFKTYWNIVVYQEELVDFRDDIDIYCYKKLSDLINISSMVLEVF